MERRRAPDHSRPSLDHDPRAEAAAPAPPEWKLYPQRWVQLAYLSLFAGLSDWVCFSVCAVPAAAEAALGGLHPSMLVTNLEFFTGALSGARARADADDDDDASSWEGSEAWARGQFELFFRAWLITEKRR